MPVLLFIGVVALVTGISALAMHNSVSESNSESTSSSNIFDEIEETKEDLEQEIKIKVLLGTVTIIAYIQNKEEMKKQQHEEMIQSISGGVAAATALGAAVTMNVVQDAIAESQNQQGQEIGATTSQSQTTEVSGSVAIPNNGPISIPPLIAPDIGPIGTPPLIPPALKELEDYINWAKKKKTKENTNSNDNNESGNKEKILGENGTQVASETTWQNGKTERIDVENPSPGKRAGQIHYHEPNNTKWYFDIIKKVFYNPKTGELAPKKIQKLLNNEDFIKGINKALKLLGENKLK